MIANVYIDGFNLYYGCLKGTPYTWLDLDALSRRLLPGHEINRIRYFTAKVVDRPRKPGAAQRQAIYLSRVRMPLANPPAGGPSTVEVIKTEEKGSDVNLATHLVSDVFKQDCEPGEAWPSRRPSSGNLGRRCWLSASLHRS